MTSPIHGTPERMPSDANVAAAHTWIKSAVKAAKLQKDKDSITFVSATTPTDAAKKLNTSIQHILKIGGKKPSEKQEVLRLLSGFVQLTIFQRAFRSSTGGEDAIQNVAIVFKARLAKHIKEKNDAPEIAKDILAMMSTCPKEFVHELPLLVDMLPEAVGRSLKQELIKSTNNSEIMGTLLDLLTEKYKR